MRRLSDKTLLLIIYSKGASNLIIRSKGVTAEALENIYKTLSQVIKDETCFYTKEELKELKDKEYILIGGLKND